MRLTPIDIAASPLLDFNTSQDVKVMQYGTYVGATSTDYDTTANVANWGGAEVMYVNWQGSTVLTPGSLVQTDKNFTITATGASEANSGKPVYVTLTNFQIGNVTPQNGWVMRRGICPVQYSVAATTGAVFGGTAGKATPTAAAGVQILGMRCLIAGATAFTKSGTVKANSSLVKFSGTVGMYPGQAISGTGIPASSVISSVSRDGFSVRIGSAIGTEVVATASGFPTITLTNTGYGICQLDNAAFQSQIT